jgi:multiple sugar transport system substrate-binding protein
MNLIRNLGLALMVSAGMAAPVAAKTEITAAGWDDLGQMMSKIVNPQIAKKRVSATFLQVPADFDKFLQNGLSAGTAPDLFYVDINWAYPLFASGKVAELPEAEFAATLAAMPRSLRQAFYQNGKLYGIAKDFATLTVAYNRDLFEDAGVEAPSDDDTWESLGAKLKALQEALGDGYYGACLPASYDRFGAVAFAYGWRPFDTHGRTVLDERFASALAFWRGLKDSGAGVVPQDIGASWTGDCLKSDKVGIAIEGPWINGFLRDNAPAMNYGSTMMPKGPGGERGNFLYTVSWSLNAATGDRPAALAALKALVSVEAQTFRLENYGAIPIDGDLSKFPYMEAEGAGNDLVRRTFRGSQEGVVIPFSGGMNGGAWMDVINTVIADVMINNAEIDDAVARGQARLDALP